MTRFVLPVLLWGLIAGGVIYAVYASDRPPDDLEEVDLAGVTEPHVLPAEHSPLPDHAPVIGLTVNGRHRAYSVATLSAVNRHVVNDRLGDTPVAVTYCDRTDCAKAFKGDFRGKLLNMRVGGYLGTRAAGTMLVKLESTRFRQDSGCAVGTDATIPYPETPITRTTWKEWRELHPETDVYDGTAEGGRLDAN